MTERTSGPPSGAGGTDRLRAALSAIDAANAQDPRRVDTPAGQRAREVWASERVTAWLARLVPDASELLQLAGRAHHLRRWTVPRSSYPEGRTGYLQWRRELHDRHAARKRLARRVEEPREHVRADDEHGVGVVDGFPHRRRRGIEPAAPERMVAGEALAAIDRLDGQEVEAKRVSRQDPRFDAALRADEAIDYLAPDSRDEWRRQPPTVCSGTWYRPLN